MNLNKRLNDFIDNNYKSTENFAKASRISVFLINAFINNEKDPDNNDLIQFHKAGVNIDWLLTGYGDYYAKNSVGQALQQMNNNGFNSSSNEIVLRIHQWIEQNFNSLDEFFHVTDISEETFNDNLITSVTPKPDFMLALAIAGCNIDWFMTGIGSPYASNPNGVILKIKNKNNCSENIEDQKLNSELNSFFENLTRR